MIYSKMNMRNIIINLFFYLGTASCYSRLYMKSSDSFNKALKNRVLLHETPYNILIKDIEEKKVSKIYFSPRLDEVISENIEEVDNVINDFSFTKINPQITNNLVDVSVKNNVEPIFAQVVQPNQIQVLAGDILGAIDTYFVPFLILTFFINFVRSFFTNGGNTGTGNPFMPNFGNVDIDVNKDKEAMKNANITLNSFAGSPEIFEECTEVVSYLKDETRYKDAGAEIPRGILLEGPPGTGKTLLAKAIASEADANFISISASEFIEVFVGVGAAKIRSLFENARKNKPCIIFIDEIDSIGRQRGAGVNIGNDEREQTLNQLLAEMDGFVDNTGVLVIAATNRKDVLDSALLRPGRFDRLITVSLPDKNSREAILKVHAKNKKLSPGINLGLIAEATSGFSGAQLKNLLNEAAIFAARKNETIIQEYDVLDAVDKLIVGLARKYDSRSDEARRRVAIHEIGHAFVCANFNDTFELKKVTIQSTYNGAGGYTIFNDLPEVTESGLYTKNILKKRLVVAMGGKAAESLFYGDEHVSLGAVQDLKTANSLAQQMIGNYGMGNKLETFYNENVESGRNPFLGRSMAMGDKYSEKTKETMDIESLELVHCAYIKAKCYLSNNKEIVDKLIDVLLKNNTLYGKDVYSLINTFEDVGNSYTICELPRPLP